MQQSITSNYKNISNPVDNSQVEVHTIGKSVANKVHIEVDNVMTMVETRVQENFDLRRKLTKL